MPPDMLEWLKRRCERGPSVFPRETLEAGRLAKQAMSGPYLLLYTYLDTRFADTVVLTFAQVEDLLGFALPAQARLRAAWWTADADGGAVPHYSHSWTFAKRTAVPNLAAQIVSFARAV
jgi:hypothetical protein